MAGVPEPYLISISVGAVFCGAITYIGNGPNFMVKSVADSRGVNMPSFGGYILRSFEHLVPILVAMCLLLIAQSLVAHVIGGLIVVGVLALAASNMLRARAIRTNNLQPQEA